MASGRDRAVPAGGGAAKLGTADPVNIIAATNKPRRSQQKGNTGRPND
jgi:hypothetical protein